MIPEQFFPNYSLDYIKADYLPLAPTKQFTQRKMEWQEGYSIKTENIATKQP